MDKKGETGRIRIKNNVSKYPLFPSGKIFKDLPLPHPFPAYT